MYLLSANHIRNYSKAQYAMVICSQSQQLSKSFWNKKTFNVLMDKRFIFYVRNKTSAKNTFIHVVHNQTHFRHNKYIGLRLTFFRNTTVSPAPSICYRICITSVTTLFFLLLNFLVLFFFFSSGLTFVPVFISLSSSHLNLNINFSNL